MSAGAKTFIGKLFTLTPSTGRVARWYIFKPKIKIWVIIGGSCNGRCWYIMWTFDLFYSHLVI
jgi:hypothetical protein